MVEPGDAHRKDQAEAFNLTDTEFRGYMAFSLVKLAEEGAIDPIDAFAMIDALFPEPEQQFF